LKKGLAYFITGVLIPFFLSWSFIQDRFRSETSHNFQTDTIYVNKPYKEIEIKYVDKPVKIYIYKTDTLYRKQIEKDTLITSVEITPQLAKIHTITPQGLPMIKNYDIRDFKALKIDHEGNVSSKKKRKHKKFFRTLERIALVLSGVLIGSKLH